MKRPIAWISKGASLVKPARTYQPTSERYLINKPSRGIWLKNTQAEFNQWAHGNGCKIKSYDYMLGDPDTYPAPWRMFELIQSLLKPGSEIIDFACGSGLSGEYFIDLDHLVDGIDFSRNMLKLAEGRGYRQLWNRDLEEDDLTGLVNFDLAICVGTIGHFLTPELMIPKMKVLNLHK